jgi:small subunit ribosomal protein S9
MNKKVASSQTIHGVGRRKAAVARVWLKPGKGAVEVNGKDFTEYFGTDIARSAVVFPFQICGAEKMFDTMVYVSGGGETGQSGAIKLGIARALLKSNEALKGVLRQNDLLTVDARVKERKKYGQKGARRKFQFVKR